MALKALPALKVQPDLLELIQLLLDLSDRREILVQLAQIRQSWGQ